MPFSDHPYVVATLIALIPAAASWVSGHRLARRLEDPMLPERFMSHQRRNGVLMVLAFVAAATIASTALPLTIPVMYSGLVAAGYPLRRVMFGETWSFGAYCSFFHRLTIALFGVWVFIGVLPVFAAAAGSADWLAGAIGAGVLLAWNHYYSEVLRHTLRCTPLEDGPLLTRCRQLATQCGLPQPLFLRADLHGGVVANALALPSLGGNAVLFTGTLLERLDEDEVVAICGHELAHLEYFNPARLRMINRATVVVIVLGALVAPVERLLAASTVWVYLAWFGALLGVMLLRARDKQRQETVCDARAVQLTGGPEPLVSGLTKLYASARMPRRIAMEQDRAASHPSLSRRIRDIRRAAGVQPSALTEPATVFGADGSSTVTFDTASLNWEQDAGVTQVISYPHLHELRLDLARSGGPRLCARSDGGRRWEMRVSASDVPRVQALLDAVDGQLGDAPGPRGLPFSFSRLVVALLSILATTVGHVTVAVVVLLAWLRPAPALLGGAAAAAFAAAMLALRDGSSLYGTPTPLLLAAAAGILLTFAVMNRHQETRGIRVPLAAILTVSAMLLLSMVLGGFDAIQLHQSARSTPGLPVLLVSAAAAMAWPRQRRRTYAAAALVSLALASAALSSLAFLDAFGKDPFLVDAPAIATEVVETTLVDRFTLPETTTRVHMSPGGQFVAALQENYTDDDRSSTFHVGRLGEPLQALAGDSLRFLDDDTVLIVERDRDGTTLRQVRLTSTLDVVWRQRVPHLQGAVLSLSADGGWHLQGWDAGEAIIRAEGTIGAAEFRERRWPATYARDAWIDAITTAGPEPLVVETRYDRGLLERLPVSTWIFAMMLNAGGQQSRYWLAGGTAAKPLGESRLGANCSTGVGDGALVCGVYDGARTRLIRLDAQDGSVSGIGWLTGRFIADDAAVDGWLTGWLESSAIAVDLVNRRALRLARHEELTGALTVSGNRIAAIVMDGGSPSLRVYRIPAPEGAAARRSASAPGLVGN